MDQTLSIAAEEGLLNANCPHESNDASKGDYGYEPQDTQQAAKQLRG
jgi:hypothetical protein